MGLLNDMRFPLLRLRIIAELDSYKKHTTKVEALMDKELQEFETSLAEIMNDWDVSDREIFSNSKFCEYEDLKFTFPNIQRRAELMSVYSIFEKSINNICIEFQEKESNPVQLSDLDANGIIQKAQKYLIKVARIKFPSDHPSWIETLKIQKIRNSIVHNDGHVKTGNSELLGYISNSKYLSLCDRNHIQIEKGYSVHCLETFREFFLNLFSEIITSKETA